MGYGTDFGNVGGTAVGGGGSGQGAIGKKVDSYIDSKINGPDFNSVPAGLMNVGPQQDVQSKKYNPNKHKKSKACHKKHVHKKGVCK